MATWTVNVEGDVKDRVAGYHAYYANGVTAIEIPAPTKAEAKKIARQFGRVLYAYE